MECLARLLLPVRRHLGMIGPNAAHAFLHRVQQGEVILIVRQLAAVMQLPAKAACHPSQGQFGILRVVPVFGQNPVEFLHIAGTVRQPVMAAKAILQRVVDLREQGGHIRRVLHRDWNGAKFARLRVQLDGLRHRQFFREEFSLDPLNLAGDGFRACVPYRIVDQGNPALQVPVERFAVEETLVPRFPENPRRIGGLSHVTQDFPSVLRASEHGGKVRCWRHVLSNRVAHFYFLGT